MNEWKKEKEVKAKSSHRQRFPPTTCNDRYELFFLYSIFSASPSKIYGWVVLHHQHKNVGSSIDKMWQFLLLEENCRDYLRKKQLENFHEICVRQVEGNRQILDCVLVAGLAIR